MFDIEKNMPRNQKYTQSERTLFLKSLDVNDSFVCTREEYDMIRSYQKAAKIKLSSETIQKYECDDSMNPYAVRRYDKLRVWRIE